MLQSVVHVGGSFPVYEMARPNFLYFVDRASLYNLVDKTNLVHNFS